MTQNTASHLVRLRLIGEIYAPVHAGTGETLDPFSLIRHKDRLHRVDLEDLLTTLEPDKVRVATDLINTGNLVALRQRLQDWYDPARHPSRWSVAMSPAFREQYQAAMQSDQNRLEIAAHRRHPVTGQPYIPGSTIKGALRTALVAMRAAAAQAPQREELKRLAGNKHEQKNFEPALFGRRHSEMNRDPFRALRVGDAVVRPGPPAQDGSPRPDPMTVGTVTIRSLNPVGAARLDKNDDGIPMQYEYVRGGLMDGKLASPPRFSCTVTFDEHVFDKGGLAGRFTPPELVKAVHQFYLENLKHERERFMTPWNLVERLKALDDMAHGLKPEKGEFLLRLGRFSHLENLTVRPPFRHAYSPQKRSEIADSNSRALAEGCWPFGWVICRFRAVKD
jgi:hypothetical protein